MVEWWNPVLLEVIHKLVSMNFIRWVFEKTLLECSEGGGGDGRGVCSQINRV